MRTRTIEIRRTTGLFLAFALLLGIVSEAFCEIELTITNGSFESPSLPDGGFHENGSVVGWTGQGIFGIANPNDSLFMGTADPASPNPIDGRNAAYINFGGRLVYADPTWLLEPDIIYTLTLKAGQRSGVPFGNATFSIWAGTNLLAQGTPNPSQGTFVTLSVSTTLPTLPAAIGQAIRIEILAPTPESQVWFDNIRLTKEDIVCTPHKPSATALLFNGVFVGAIITDTGCGYTNVPPVTIEGGGGSGATAVAVVVDGRVREIRVTNGGCCYTNPPNIIVQSPPRVPTIEIRVSKVRVRQNVTLGRKYALESSVDFQTWTAVGPPFTAAAEVIDGEYDVETVGRFFRLRETP